MGINFGNTAPVSTGITEVPAENGGFTLDLDKGVVLDLTKREPGLKNIIFAAGWDANTSYPEFDLDVSAFLLNANGKITAADDIIYFKHLNAQGITMSGDSRTGDGDGDDETIAINLEQIPDKYASIVFTINIYEAAVRKQTFGMVKNSYCRLLNADENNKELCRFRLKDDYGSYTAVIVAQLKRDSGEWNFVTVGDGKVVSDLNGIAALYM